MPFTADPSAIAAAAFTAAARADALREPFAPVPGGPAPALSAALDAAQLAVFVDVLVLYRIAESLSVSLANAANAYGAAEAAASVSYGGGS